MHSYISATGDLWPCDFVPLSFGNVLKEDLAEVYARMLDAVGIPKTYCWACKLAGELQDRRLPLGKAESHALARADRSSSYPQFFRDLQDASIGARPRNVEITPKRKSHPASTEPQRRPTGCATALNAGRLRRVARRLQRVA